MKTYSPKASEIERAWWVVDGTDAVLGRLAADVARVLRGKHKATFAPHLDTGDFVIVVNASKVRLTGDKLNTKKWHRHSGYPGGLTSLPYSRLMNERPEMVVEKAIKGMLPRNRLGRAMSGKLKVYAGADHPHKAQKPKTWVLGQVPQPAASEGSSK
jgi:large subunit ribosomal protein L13